MIRELVLPALLVVGMNANAEENYYQDEWDSKGLIGVEVGFMGTTMKYDQAAVGAPADFGEKTVNAASIGLKFGAETKHYRFFLEGKYWNNDKYEGNDAMAVGGALQYLIRFNETFNIFLGVNAGSINTVYSEWDPYGGVDAGVNIDLTTNFGIELGARYDAVASGSNEEGKLKDFYQGYISAIFKFTGDY